ncbi:MAG: site-specific integrase [Bacteroidota bacterium]
MSNPRIVIRKNQAADGSYPLQIRFSRKGELYRFNIDINVQLKDWDPMKGMVKGRSEDVKNLNHRISQALARANDIIVHYDLVTKAELTPEKFKSEFFSAGSKEDFLIFWQLEMISRYQRRLMGDAVLVAETRTLEKLRNRYKSVPFTQIGRKWLEEFDAWHAKQLREKGYEGNRERRKALRQIKKYLGYAKNNYLQFIDPFQNFDLPKYSKDIVYLEEKELQLLIKLWRNKNLLRKKMKAYAERQEMRPFDVARYTADKQVERIWKVIVAFLFQCFTGVRHSDLKALSHQNLTDDLLIFVPVKTRNTSGKKVFFPITPMIRELIMTSSGALIEVTSNQKYNKQLKIVAEITQLEKHLTSHVGRHTFGSMMVANGVSLVSLTDLMGVTSVRTVMVYAHSSLETQKRELLKAHKSLIKG